MPQSSSETIISLSAITDITRVESPEWYRNMLEAVNDLIIHHFSQLVQILYLVDVSENKLKQLLQNKPAANAAELITRLLLERQLEKIESRKRFSNPSTDIPESEKW